MRGGHGFFSVSEGGFDNTGWAEFTSHTQDFGGSSSPQRGIFEEQPIELLWFQDVLIRTDSLCCWENWMADCCTPDGSAVQEGCGEGIEPANSVLKIWGSHL